MKVILKDKEFEVIQVVGESAYIENFNRDVLAFHFEKGKYSFDELDEAFSNVENTSKIKLVEEEKEYIHDDYSIKVSVGTENVLIQNGNSNTQDTFKERIVVKLAKLNYAEKQLKSQQEQIDELMKLVKK